MKVTPAPCLVCKSDLTIRQVVVKMRQNRADYALFKDKSGKVIGIVTESDILNHMEKIVDNSLFDKGISQIMNGPVKTLPIHLYHTAPEFFRTHNVQHAPVTDFNNQTGHDEVVGIITSETIMDAMVHARGLPYLYALGGTDLERRSIGVASPDGSLFNLIKKVYEPADKIDVERLRFANLQTDEQLIAACETYDGIVLDLEGAPDRYWEPTVKFCAGHKNLEFLAVVVNPEDEKTKRENLMKLQSDKVLHVYNKPLNLNRLTREIEKFWGQSENQS